MDDQGFLPLGSVVRLGKTDALAMVMGYRPVVGEGAADYLGVPYPMGLVSDDAAIAFDRDAIDAVVFEGYLDETGRKAFAAVREYREATQDMLAQVDKFIESLTPERVEELRAQYGPAPLPDDFEVPEGFADISFD